MLRKLEATQYLVPLREGGSLPAVVGADDGHQYVMKFRGAGQGPKALIAEIVAGEIGRHLGLPIPELVLLELSPLLARSEVHEEIQDLLRASVGLNLGLAYLPGAQSYNPLLPPPVPDSLLASSVVWFDAFVTNVDRTARNTNLLLWQKKIWLIDHGAALYWHHDWNGYQERIASPFALIRQHVLLPWARELEAVDELFVPELSDDFLRSVLALVPDVWLEHETVFATVDEQRAAYLNYFRGRRAASASFVQEALRARSQLL